MHCPTCDYPSTDYQHWAYLASTGGLSVDR